MLISLGIVANRTVLLANGFDSVRGIIEREYILDNNLVVFNWCPQVHSFFVRHEFYATFFSASFQEYKTILMKPNRLSPFYSFNSICIEHKDIVEIDELRNIKGFLQN